MEELLRGNTNLKEMKSQAGQYKQDKVLSKYCDDCYFKSKTKRRL